MKTSPRSLIAAEFAFALAALSIPLRGQSRVIRVDVDPSGAEASGDFVAISGDGRYVAFDSDDSHLVSNDTNGSLDVFVKDRVTGAVTRVSVSTSGAEGDNWSFQPVISTDGRYVAFVSLADNLVANDTNTTFDLFVHDRDPDGNGIYDEGNGATTRADVDSNGSEAAGGAGYGSRHSISGDGRYVAFDSGSDDLVANDSNKAGDCFVHDNVTGATTLVSLDSAGNQGDASSGEPAISRDGKFVAFESDATNLVASDHNGHTDVFLRDLAAGATVRVNLNPSGGGAAKGDSRFPAISSDGRFVAFLSSATNLVPGDVNGKWDAFVRDTVNATTLRVSVDSAGNESNEDCYTGVALSDDGQQVVFESRASNIDARDTNKLGDTFVHDSVLGTTELVSLTCFGRSADGESSPDLYVPAVSGDGGLVAFVSAADDLVAGDTNGLLDVFVCDRAIPWPVASFVNYGAGFPGTLGVPSITAGTNPQFGASSSVDVGNSAGVATSGLLVVGFMRISQLTPAGGTLLASLDFLLPETIPASGESIGFTVPFDVNWCGLVVDVQMLEVDAGAAHGLSFTPGLELVIGQ